MSAIDLLSREYPNALRRKKELSRQLEQFESGQNRSVAAQQSLETTTQMLGKQVQDLEDLLNECEHEMERTNRELWDRLDWEGEIHL